MARLCFERYNQIGVRTRGICLVLLALVAVSVGCQGPERYSLGVSLRTDYQPIRDFVGVTVKVGALSGTARARIDAAYLKPGESIHTFENLEPASERRVEVILDAGAGQLAETVIAVEHKKDLLLTVHISRQCGDVVCGEMGEDETRCLGGQCVSIKCRTGEEPECPGKGQCQASSECTTLSPCAQPICQNGFCSECSNEDCYEDGYDPCMEGFECDYKLGCVKISGVDPCTPETVMSDCDPPSECGAVSCQSELCFYGFAPTGTPCSGGGTCDSGVCVPPQCSNQVEDADESDVDCGGSVCAGCELGQKCNMTFDCRVGVCDMKESHTCEPINTCGNGVLEGSEACDDGNTANGDGCQASCLLGTGDPCDDGVKCESKLCTGVCRAPTNVYIKIT